MTTMKHKMININRKITVYIYIYKNNTLFYKNK